MPWNAVLARSSACRPHCSWSSVRRRSRTSVAWSPLKTAKLVILLQLLLLPLFAAHATDDSAPSRVADEPSPVQLEVGLRFGFLSRALATDDVYSSAAANGLSVEFPVTLAGGAVPLHLGATVSVYSFGARDARYSDSIMVAPGLSLAYVLLRRGDGSSQWSVLP